MISWNLLWRMAPPFKMLRHSERLARVLTATIFLVFIMALAAVLLAPFSSRDRVIELVARQPEAGGWSRERIVVKQGERVRLRIRSEDVVHGFAIGRLGVDAGAIEPGKATTVEFIADRTGEFTFYCTTWCDPNHPRMRGILEVRGSSETPEKPLATDITLQHLDESRDAGNVPSALPSVTRGALIYAARCASCHGTQNSVGESAPVLGGSQYLRNQSPAEIYRMLTDAGGQGPLSSAPVNHSPQVHSARARSHRQEARRLSDQERWDTIASLWSLSTTPERLAVGERLYLRNCAACHGERGAGDGPGGTKQPKTPANFTDARRMLAGTTDLYTAKIRRGGMGTGMPYWGSIFTEDELSALVDFVWTFSLSVGP